MPRRTGAGVRLTDVPLVGVDSVPASFCGLQVDCRSLAIRTDALEKSRRKLTRALARSVATVTLLRYAVRSHSP